MYDIEENVFFVSRDVVFDENCFPYQAVEDDEFVPNLQPNIVVIDEILPTSGSVVLSNSNKPDQEKISADIPLIQSSEPVIISSDSQEGPALVLRVTEATHVARMEDMSFVEQQTENQEQRLGKGCRQKFPSVRLSGYKNIMLNAIKIHIYHTFFPTPHQRSLLRSKVRHRILLNTLFLTRIFLCDIKRSWQLFPQGLNLKITMKPSKTKGGTRPCPMK